MRLTRLLSSALALFATAGTAFAAQPVDGKITFQEAATPVMERIDSFHTFVFIIITIITVFVMALMLFIMIRFNEKAIRHPQKHPIIR